MLHLLATSLLAVSCVGLALLLVQLVSLRRHLRERPRAPRRLPGVSVLKPLCGLDDDLARHLQRFATIDYPEYELLLGVKDAFDPAFPVACAVARRFPSHVRVLVQRGEPGLNPKVNQLSTLARAARHDIVVVSDSNVTVGADYLHDIAAHLADREVGLVTHPVAGIGEQKLGALLDNLHLSGSVGPGMVGAKRVGGKDVVVGKSMALRRSDLARLGGFEAFANVLAEDYVIGKEVARTLGKRVAIANTPVWNVSRRRSVREFVARYRRWSVIHRQAVGLLVYACEPLLNPTAFASLAFLVHPSQPMLLALFAVVFLRSLLDGATGSSLRRERFSFEQLLAVPLKDWLLFFAWVHGLLANHVEWRSNKLRVLAGTVLALPEEPPVEPDGALVEDAA